MKHNLIAEEQANYSSDDGLETPDVGIWALDKYSILRYYNHMFGTGMKKKWDMRVYIDLFAGPGKVRIRDNGRIVLGSPLIALDIEDQYDAYIFCEEKQVNLDALIDRVGKKPSNSRIEYLHGDCNDKVDDILKILSEESRGKSMLSFCFIDPYSLKIKFDTLRKLSHFRIDILMLMALGMDVNRNLHLYQGVEHKRIDDFLGRNNWRSDWETFRRKHDSVERFLAEEYVMRMVSLGYQKTRLADMVPIKNKERRGLLYYLAFFSKDDLGISFWRKVIQGQKQISMDL